MGVFLLLLTVAYGTVWLVFYAARPGYQHALGIGAQTWYEVEGKRLKFWLEGEETVFRSYLRPPFEARLSPRPLFSNLPFLLTLILVTPGLLLRRRAKHLLVGLLLLYLSHVAFLVVKVEAVLVSAKHMQAGSAALWGTLDDFLEVSGKAFFPILIWLSLCLPYMLGRVDRLRVKQDEAPQSRNAPCPCGSGRKYKRCCGGAV